MTSKVNKAFCTGQFTGNGQRLIKAQIWINEAQAFGDVTVIVVPNWLDDPGSNSGSDYLRFILPLGKVWISLIILFNFQLYFQFLTQDLARGKVVITCILCICAFCCLFWGICFSHINPIYPTPPLGQDMIQGQFLSGVYQVWIQSFPSPRLVASPRLKNLVYPTTYR